MIPISVVIPTYNRRESLKRALSSVLAQKGVSFEVIVIDDGSTDDTRSLIAKEFPEIRYYFFENQGPAAARNRGIEKAKGQWIAFLDSDDEWKPGKLQAQMDFLKNNPEMKICQTEEIWIRNGVRVNPMKKHKKYGGWIFEKCLPLCVVSPSAVMLEKTLLNDAGLFDESFPACEDYDLWLRISARYPVGLIEKPYVIKYGGHADQRSHEFPVMDKFRIRAILKLMASGILNPKQHEAAKVMMETKAEIVIQGAKKRKKFEEAAQIENLVSRLKLQTV